MSNDRERLARVYDLSTTGDTSLVGDVGELIAKHYLWGIVKIHFLHKFSLHGAERKWIERTIKDEEMLNYLMDSKGRRWDLIGVRHRYRSRYGRRKVERAAAELRSAIRKNDEQEREAKEEEFRWLLKRFRIEEVFLIEVKTVRENAIRHDLTPVAKHKIGNVEEAKSHGFKVLLVIITLLSAWKFQCECLEL